MLIWKLNLLQSLKNLIFIKKTIDLAESNAFANDTGNADRPKDHRNSASRGFTLALFQYDNIATSEKLWG